MDLEILEYVPPRYATNRSKDFLAKYLLSMLENEIKKVITLLNESYDDSVLSFQKIRITGDRQKEDMTISLSLLGEPLEFTYDILDECLSIEYKGNTSMDVYIVGGEINCTQDRANLFISPEERIKSYKIHHIEALIDIMDDICRDNFTTVFKDGKEIPANYAYMHIGANCQCRHVPSVSSNVTAQNVGLRDVMLDRMSELDFNNPFNKNSPLYFDCEYVDSQNQILQLVRPLTMGVFRSIEKYDKLEFDLQQYPILIARKCCHTMLLSHRYGTSSLSQLPKDVLLLILRKIWRTRYDVDMWFR